MLRFWMTLKRFEFFILALGLFVGLFFLADILSGFVKLIEHDFNRGFLLPGFRDEGSRSTKRET